MYLKYIAHEEDKDRTVKYVLKVKLHMSESLIKKLKMNARILKNNIPVYVNALVIPGDSIEAHMDIEEESSTIVPEKIDIDIIYEDESMIVINKQPNMVVHPTSTHTSGTVANAVMYHWASNGTTGVIRPVSRLDRDTSGIIIFAKNQYIQEMLIQQMHAKTFTKEYIGVVNGIPSESQGTINLPISREPGSIMLRHVSPDGSPSVTHFRVIELLNNASVLQFQLETGRTHQIRVHCQAINHPLIGDTLYSNLKTDLITRQALHSHRVIFTHPISKEQISFTAPIPPDIEHLIQSLKI